MDARRRTRRRIGIIGGGISGLATAYFLSTVDGPISPEITLIEATGRLGGKVRTESFADLSVDVGPDALVVRSSEMTSLLSRLGLADATVAQSKLGAYVLCAGKLRRIPSGTTAGVPGRLLPVLRSRILSPVGLVRAGLDLVAPRFQLPPDPTVGQLLRPRFGGQVFRRLVDPLVGGLHAGHADLLSARSTVPEIAAVAGRSRSLYLGLRQGRRALARATASSGISGGAGAGGGQGFSMVSIEGGLGRLVEAMAARLPADSVRSGIAVATLRRCPDGGYDITLADGETITVDAVVVATPAFVTASLMARLAPPVADALRDIAYADVATVTLRYAPETVGRPLDGTGFLVPPSDGSLVVGCTWLARKWPHLASCPDTLIRCAVGRYGGRTPIPPTDDALVRRVHDEISGVLRLTAGPRQSLVQRWPRSMPQYTVGHADRLDRIEQALRRVPNLHLTGAAYRGMGLATCIDQARKTANEVVTRLASEPVTAEAVT